MGKGVRIEYSNICFKKIYIWINVNVTEPNGSVANLLTFLNKN